jgi:hypothetical protein
MRIGFASIYSWRPHVEHLQFLAALARKAGHETFFLSCDGDLPSCYTRELRGKAAWRECLQCRAGGIHSYDNRNAESIGELAGDVGDASVAARTWATSSASTLGRFETDEDFASPEFARIVGRLEPAVAKTYAAASEWIRRNRLDAICLFNGRMDMTRAIAEAAVNAGIRYVSMERTWFGDGLQLQPDESCLGLRCVHPMMLEWRDRPLTRQQALLAGSHIAARFLRTNQKEWRAYNANARNVEWPGGAGARRKILLVPSSRNEIFGHPDWDTGWPEPTAAYDALLDHFKLQPGEAVLRCHPNWAENVGKFTGVLAERYFADWAQRRGVPCIRAADTASTQGLIDQCDAIVVAGGSAGLEAGILGKQVISVGPSIYQEAGFRDPAYNPAELASVQLHCELDAAARAAAAHHNARQTLRFCYTAVYRIPQYTREVKARKTTEYRYDLDADPQRFIDLLKTGRLQPDDTTFAADTSGEEEVLELIESRQWARLVPEPHVSGGQYGRIRRRLMYRPIDWIADKKPVGDR